MAKDISNFIPPLPQRSRAGLVKAEADHNSIALLEFQSPSAALIGEPAPLMARLMSFLLASCVLVLTIGSFLIPVDMVVTAPSITVSHGDTTIVQPLETAIVRKVLVKPGQKVKKGQLLAVLDPTFAASDAKSTVAQMNSLRAQVDRLRAELGNKEYVSDGSSYGDAQAQMWQERHANYQAQVDSLKQTVEADRYKVTQLNADLEGYKARLPLAQQTENMRAKLAKVGLDSELDLLQATDYRVQIEADIADAQEQLKSALHELQVAIANLDAFVHQWYSETNDTLATQERSLSDMIDQATKNKLRTQLDELRSPADGIVLTVSHVSVGSVMQSGDELMRITPTDAAVDIEGTITGSDAGYVHVGDLVTVKFDTLPYIIYGFAFGRVEHISPDSFSNLPAPQANPLPSQPQVGAQQASAQPGVSPVAYTVRISLGEVKLHDVPPTFKIVPGMPVTADIKVGRRSIFQYLFERVVPTFVEGMREPQ
jgi:HlyD family secretion protein